MQLIGYGKEYLRQAQPKHSRLQQDDRELCFAAIPKFTENPRNRGLNFERLGNGAQNHWSIRASKELRVILAADPPRRTRQIRARQYGASRPNVRVVGAARLPYKSCRFHSGVSTGRPGQCEPRDSSAELRGMDALSAAGTAAADEPLSFRRSAHPRRGGDGQNRDRTAPSRRTRPALCAQTHLVHNVQPFSLHPDAGAFPASSQRARECRFQNIDRVAWDTLKRAKRLPDKTDFNKNPQKIAEAFEAAYRRVVPAHRWNESGAITSGTKSSASSRAAPPPSRSTSTRAASNGAGACSR